MRPLKMLACVAALLLITAEAAMAQLDRGGGQNSFGGSSFGGGGGGFGTSSFGSGGSGGFGNSGFGASSFGGTGFGGSGFGGSGLGQNSFGNSQSGQQGGQGFIGRDSADMASIFNQLGRNSNQLFQQLNRSSGRGNRGQRNSSQGENVAPPVRVQLHVAFDHRPTQPAIVATTVRGRLERLLAHRDIVVPDVEIAGDSIVLRGVAASESQRLVIEKLVSLEPGVVAVDNRMTVAALPQAEN